MPCTKLYGTACHARIMGERTKARKLAAGIIVFCRFVAAGARNRKRRTRATETCQTVTSRKPIRSYPPRACTPLFNPNAFLPLRAVVLDRQFHRRCCASQADSSAARAGA